MDDKQHVPSFWFIFFSHHPYCQLNRTLQLTLFNKRIVLCTRCTGQYSLMFLYLLLSLFIAIKEPFWLACFLPLPATLDWLTQALQWRESTTLIRFLTGGLFGIWLAVICKHLGDWDASFLLHSLYQCLIYIAGTMLVLLAKKGSIDEYLLPYETFISEYQANRKA